VLKSRFPLGPETNPALEKNMANYLWSPFCLTNCLQSIFIRWSQVLGEFLSDSNVVVVKKAWEERSLAWTYFPTCEWRRIYVFQELVGSLFQGIVRRCRSTGIFPGL